MSEIVVTVKVTDANGQDSDVMVTRELLPGDTISSAIHMTATEAAGVAVSALPLGFNYPIQRYYRGR